MADISWCTEEGSCQYVVKAVTIKRTLCTDPVSKEEGEFTGTGGGEGFQAPYQQEEERGKRNEERREQTVA